MVAKMPSFTFADIRQGSRTGAGPLYRFETLHKALDR